MFVDTAIDNHVICTYTKHACIMSFSFIQCSRLVTYNKQCRRNICTRAKYIQCSKICTNKSLHYSQISMERFDVVFRQCDGVRTRACCYSGVRAEETLVVECWEALFGKFDGVDHEVGRPKGAEFTCGSGFGIIIIIIIMSQFLLRKLKKKYI